MAWSHPDRKSRPAVSDTRFHILITHTTPQDEHQRTAQHLYLLQRTPRLVLPGLAVVALVGGRRAEDRTPRRALRGIQLAAPRSRPCPFLSLVFL